jgi:cell fate (sporulation/competence/biofilm development) regulator YlbF (YheA/YmcA/DUF963 family)
MTINLIDGNFTKEDAHALLLEFINSKINYHKLRSFSESEWGVDNSHSEKRIKELKNDYDNLSVYLNDIGGDVIKIKCNIELESE